MLRDSEASHEQEIPGHAECGGKTFAKVDEKKPDGKFGPGNDLRCVNCKVVKTAPSPTKDQA